MYRLLQIAAALLLGLLGAAGQAVAQSASQAASPAASQVKKVALVIGNSQYQYTAKLENPRNDAADVAEVLKKLGFVVIEGRDLDKAAMDRTVRDFAKGLSGAQVGLFFYAGHGIQVAGQNYLVPVDAELSTGSAVDFEMVRLDLVHRTMEREAPTNIIMIDACRDNPLSRNLARALGTRSTQIQQGFATVESGEGTLISFSTQPGNVALDGKGRNSPYAAALMKHIAVPGDDLPTILINVRNDVMRATERRQVPWEHSAMTAKFYFSPPKSTQAQVELAFWMAVKDTNNPAVLATYLDRYPSGEFATVARALIEHYDGRLKLEVAKEEAARKLEAAKKLEEEAKRAADLTRAEDEQKAREAALAAERRRVEEAKRIEKDRADSLARDQQQRKAQEEARLVRDAAKAAEEAKRLEKERADALARAEQLRKAQEEARLAREAAKAAEEKRLAAVKAAETATKAAEDTIAKKREADKTSNPTKIAALPKIEKPAAGGARAFDGAWTIRYEGGSGCNPGGTYVIRVEAGALVGRSGSVSPNGAATWFGGVVTYTGTLRGSTGRGHYQNANGQCRGTWTATRG